MSSKWTAEDIPDQHGRVAIVTGANSGLGRITALELVRHGAEVVMACRNVEQGEAAAEEIRAIASGPPPVVRALDLARLDSVRSFAGELLDRRIDLLVNNTGVMMTPRRTTSDGFELQLGTNHLGHFALVGLLLETIQKSDSARIVTVSSNEHKGGRIEFYDLQLEQAYSPRGAYQRSKLANAVFAIELDRWLRAAESPAISVFAHPGYAATNLQSSGPTGLAKAAMAISNGSSPSAPNVAPCRSSTYPRRRRFKVAITTVRTVRGKCAASQRRSKRSTTPTIRSSARGCGASRKS